MWAPVKICVHFLSAPQGHGTGRQRLVTLPGRACPDVPSPRRLDEVAGHTAGLCPAPGSVDASETHLALRGCPVSHKSLPLRGQLGERLAGLRSDSNPGPFPCHPELLSLWGEGLSSGPGSSSLQPLLSTGVACSSPSSARAPRTGPWAAGHLGSILGRAHAPTSGRGRWRWLHSPRSSEARPACLGPQIQMKH